MNPCVLTREMGVQEGPAGTGMGKSPWHCQDENPHGIARTAPGSVRAVIRGLADRFQDELKHIVTAKLSFKAGAAGRVALGQVGIIL